MIKEDSGINTNTMEGNPSGQDGYEDIALRNYVLVLVAWWREIVLGAVLVTAIGTGAVLALNIVLPKYETTTDVAIIQRDSAVSIDQTFRAVSEQTNRSRRRDLAPQRAALVGLVRHGGVAVKVLEQLGGLLEDDRYSVVDLLESVEAELVTLGVASSRNQSDLIRITVSADSPEKVAAIADAWAREYVNAVNLLYQQVPQDLIDSVQNKLDEAEAAYEDSQKRLEAFIVENPIGQLERKLISITQEITSLHELSNIGSYSLKHEALQAKFGLISDYHDMKRRLTKLLGDVQSLRFEIGKGDEAGSVSNGIAIQLIKIQAYAMTSSLPEGIRIHIDKIHPIHTDAVKQRIEIDRLSEALEVRIEKIDKDIQRLSDAIIDQNVFGSMYGDNRSLNNLQQVISDKENEINMMQARKAAAAGTFDRFVQERDLAKSILNTLQNEVIELQLSSAASSSQVRLASPAVVPKDSAWPSPILTAAIGGILGLLIMSLFAFVANATGIPHYFKRLRNRRGFNNDQ